MPIVDLVPIVLVACVIAIPVFYLVSEFVNSRKV